MRDAPGETPDRRYSSRSVPVLTFAAMLSGTNDLRAMYRQCRRLPGIALSVPGLSEASRHATYRDLCITGFACGMIAAPRKSV